MANCAARLASDAQKARVVMAGMDPWTTFAPVAPCSRDEIEPFLIAKGYVNSTERGRLITGRGRMLLEEYQEEP